MRYISVFALLGMLASPGVADPASPSSARVRILDRQLRQDVAALGERSPTLQVLLDALEQSDLIVHVVAADQPGATPGALRWVTATAHVRILRVWIKTGLPRAWRVAMLAHELQHALEIAGAPQVIDDASFEALYRRIGRHGACAGCFDTAAAVHVGAQVLAELRRTLIAD